MKSQLQLLKEKQGELRQNEDLAAKFEELKAKKIERAEEWTIINTRLIIGCGCGGSGMDIHIAIPGNHPNIKDSFPSRVDTDDLRRFKSRHPEAMVMSGAVPGGITDSYNPGRYERL